MVLLLFYFYIFGICICLVLIIQGTSTSVAIAFHFQLEAKPRENQAKREDPRWPEGPDVQRSTSKFLQQIIQVLSQHVRRSAQLKR